jgi:3-oxo-5-alpha-steroid 4-dehydrogenase 1
MYIIYYLSVYLIFSFALIIFILLFYISAPYGKFLRKGWGPSVRTKWAWLIMESPSPLLMAFFFFTSDEKNLPQVIFILFWLIHYIHRAVIYPFTQSGRNKPYPYILVFMAFLFNCLNGFVNGYGVFHLLSYNPSWIISWQFIAGGIIFSSGFIINKIADEKLRKFRNGSPDEYVIPHGRMFNVISNPHYFGEIIEWGGWALMTWSLPGLAFFTFTFANLFPRGVTSHRWYRKRFPEYPPERKAVIPFLI